MFELIHTIIFKKVSTNRKELRYIGWMNAGRDAMSTTLLAEWNASDAVPQETSPLELHTNYKLSSFGYIYILISFSFFMQIDYEAKWLLTWLCRCCKPRETKKREEYYCFCFSC